MPLDRIPARTLHFFSERVFGVLVEGAVAAVSKTEITLNARYGWTTWRERVHRDTEFFYPDGDKTRLAPFLFAERKKVRRCENNATSSPANESGSSARTPR